MAAWHLDDEAATFDARERAYRLYRERADRLGAARVATLLAWDCITFRGERAVASGWLQRAHRLIDDLPMAPEHGWLTIREGSMALSGAHDPARTVELARSAARVGRMLGLVDLEMLGVALEGLGLVSQGRVEQGMRYLDEANAAAVAGEVRDLGAVNLASCWMIYGCERVRDYDRAAQWCRRLTEVCEREGIRPLFALCRTHYADVLIRRGEWDAAERELLASLETFASTRPGHLADARVRLGELRRRQGRTGEAETLFRESMDHALATLGMAEVALDRGEAALAAESARTYLRRMASEDRTERAAGLELLVRALATAGSVREAAEPLAELDEVASMVGTPPLQASALFARGVVAAARDRRAEAADALERAANEFERTGELYEAGTVRLELGRVLAASGNASRARSEIARAREAFDRLGADALRRAAEAELGELSDATTPHRPGSRPEGLTVRELDVLRLVAEGLSNQEIAGRLILSEHTVHRHVANILTKLELPSRAAAAAYAARRDLV